VSDSSVPKTSVIPLVFINSAFALYSFRLAMIPYVEWNSQGTVYPKSTSCCIGASVTVIIPSILLTIN
jgi:hypothetical protein